MTVEPIGQPHLLRVVVCGTNFGRLYAHAIRRLPERFELAGILCRGNAKSVEFAHRMGVPAWLSVEQVPDDIDLACVVVGSSVSAGAGSDLAQQLLSRGLHVLQEHPVHPDDIAAALRTARKHGVQYRLNTHYPRVRPVRKFTAAARVLAENAAIRFIDAATSVHVLQPFLEILSDAMGGLRPWGFDDPSPRSAGLDAVAHSRNPLTTVHGVVKGIPLTLRVHNELHPGDRDNHVLLWHRIAVGSDAGVLELADTHGPVLWSPQIHSGRTAEGNLVLEPAQLRAVSGLEAERLDLLSTTVAGGSVSTISEVFTDLWPDAIDSALVEMADAIAQGQDVLRAGQSTLTAAAAWADLGRRLGGAVSVRSTRPPVVSAAALGLIATERAPRTLTPPEPATSYAPVAEFFDLAAHAHTAHTRRVVVEALDGVDPAWGPVVDIGAGTGLVTVAIAASLPSSSVIAVEPVTAMRAVLMSRVLNTPGLQERVTITADRAPEIVLPHRIGAAVLCGVIGHLNAAERKQLWQRILAALAPDGVVVVELMGLPFDTSLPEAKLHTETVGEHTYHWWFGSEPSESALDLRTRWSVERDGRTVREAHDQYIWHKVDFDQIAAESGLEVTPLSVPGGVSAPMAVLRRPR